MAENKKEMERAELHRTIWAIADVPLRWWQQAGEKEDRDREVEGVL